MNWFKNQSLIKTELSITQLYKTYSLILNITWYTKNGENSEFSTNFCNDQSLKLSQVKLMLSTIDSLDSILICTIIVSLSSY